MKNEFQFIGCKYVVTDHEDVGEVKELIFSFDSGKAGAAEARRFRDEIIKLNKTAGLKLNVRLAYNKVYLSDLHIDSIRKKTCVSYVIVFVHYGITLEVDYIAEGVEYFPSIIRTSLI